jgi:hypothetical protein
MASGRPLLVDVPLAQLLVPSEEEGSACAVAERVVTVHGLWTTLVVVRSCIARAPRLIAAVRALLPPESTVDVARVLCIVEAGADFKRVPEWRRQRILVDRAHCFSPAELRAVASASAPARVVEYIGSTLLPTPRDMQWPGSMAVVDGAATAPSVHECLRHVCRARQCAATMVRAPLGKWLMGLAGQQLAAMGVRVYLLVREAHWGERTLAGMKRKSTIRLPPVTVLPLAAMTLLPTGTVLLLEYATAKHLRPIEWLTLLTYTPAPAAYKLIVTEAPDTVTTIDDLFHYSRAQSQCAKEGRQERHDGLVARHNVEKGQLRFVGLVEIGLVRVGGVRHNVVHAVEVQAQLLRLHALCVKQLPDALVHRVRGIECVDVHARRLLPATNDAVDGLLLHVGREGRVQQDDVARRL